MPGSRTIRRVVTPVIVLLLTACGTSTGQSTPGQPAPQQPIPNHSTSSPTPQQPTAARNPAAVTFRPVLTTKAATQQSCPTTSTLPDPTRQLSACDLKATTAYTMAPAFLDGTQVADATSGLDTNGNGFLVTVTFTSQGTKTWSKYTADNITKQVAIVVGDQVVSAPTIESAITGSTTQISGSLTRDDAEQLADRIMGR